MDHDIEVAVRNDHLAIEAFVAAAMAVPGDRWGEPRAPGKWSPAQVVVHVALVYEVGTEALDGAADLPSSPRVVRPIIRFMMRRTVMRTGRFPKSRTVASFDPKVGPVPGSAAAVTARLRRAGELFERRAQDKVAGGTPTFEHPVFGIFGVSEYVQFQAYHTRHHQAQLATA